LQLASVPPPIAPARWRHEIAAFDEAHDLWCGLVSDGRGAAPSLALLRLGHSLVILPPPCHNRPSRGPRPRAPLWLPPPPSCTACPGRAVLCRGPLKPAVVARWGARAAGGASSGHRRALGACDRGAARKCRLFYLSVGTHRPQAARQRTYHRLAPHTVPQGPPRPAADTLPRRL